MKSEVLTYLQEFSISAAKTDAAMNTATGVAFVFVPSGALSD